MSRSIPAGDYVEHFDPELAHHRTWLLAVLEQLVAHEPQALEEGNTAAPLDGPSGRGRYVSGTSTTAVSPTAKAPQPSQPAASALVRPAGFGHR